MNEIIEFQLNGSPVRVDTEPDRRLLWVLRNDLGLTGAKHGCGIGACGACTVLLGKNPVRSCLLSMNDVRGKNLLTIEGLANGENLHPLQQAFLDHSALQCGYCTPGMILRAHALLLNNPSPTEADVVRAMDNNLCRCGAHPRIVAAILDAANAMSGAIP